MSGYTKLPGHYSESMPSPAYDEFFTNHCNHLSSIKRFA